MCNKCGHWNLDGGADDQGLSEPDPMATLEIFNLDEVKASDIDRLRSGPWARVWGGGIVRSTVTLLSGGPGIGKSTFVQHLLDGVLEKQDGPGMYFAVEEGPEDLKARGIRLGTKYRKRILGVHHPADETVLEKALEQVKPRIAILDSLTGMVGQDYPYTVRVLEVLKGYAENYQCPAIALCHVTKDDDFAGRMSDQHLVDTTMTFSLEEKTGARVLEVVKNRHGASGLRCVFQMGEKGLVWSPEVEVGECKCNGGVDHRHWCPLFTA